MSRTKTILGTMIGGFLLAGFSLVLPSRLAAHCDTLAGPVVKDGRAALEKGDIAPVLKWVKPAGEAELKAAFARTLSVRTKGPEARDLADQYFLETLVRLHRAGEGAPYTGLKDEPVEPIIALTDQALAQGSDRELIGKISAQAASAIDEKFKRALATMKTKDTSVEAGRKFVEAYVIYTHFVEAVQAALIGTGAESHEAPSPVEHR